MKKILLCFSFFLCVLQLHAQVTFCPPGAKWNYRFEGRGNGDAGTSYNYFIEYLGDSIIPGDTLKVLLYGSFSRYATLQSSFKVLIKQRGDTVFMKNNWTNNQWQILYNYAALAGNSWTNTIASYTCKTTVNFVDTTILKNKPVRRLSVTYDDNFPGGSTYQGYIMEHIGSSDYLFNFRYKFATDIPEYREFLCYSDNTLGTIQFGTKPCNYSNGLGLNDLTDAQSLRVYPNPVQDQLNIENADGMELRIIDVSGRLLKTEIFNDLQHINTSDIPSGLYFVQFWQNNSLIYKSKIIKE